MPCLQCELPKILQETRPPDPDMVDLIEHAFIEGQIDGATMTLACCWLESRDKFLVAACELGVGYGVVTYCGFWL